MFPPRVSSALLMLLRSIYTDDYSTPGSRIFSFTTFAYYRIALVTPGTYSLQTNNVQLGVNTRQSLMKSCEIRAYMPSLDCKHFALGAKACHSPVASRDGQWMFIGKQKYSARSSVWT